MLRVNGQPFDFWNEVKNNIDPNDPKQVEWLRKENTPKVCPKCGKEHDNLNVTNHWEAATGPFGSELYKDWCVNCWKYDFDGRDLTEEEVKWYADCTEQEMEYERRGSVWHNCYRHNDFGYGEAADKKEAQVKEFLDKKWKKEAEEKRKAEEEASRKETIELLKSCGYDEDDLTSNFVNLISLLIKRIDSKRGKDEYTEADIMNMRFGG